jgi:hypothetical protein
MDVITAYSADATALATRYEDVAAFAVQCPFVDIISERYEPGSMIVTSNKLFEQRAEMFVFRFSLTPPWTGSFIARTWCRSPPSVKATG